MQTHIKECNFKKKQIAKYFLKISPLFKNLKLKLQNHRFPKSLSLTSPENIRNKPMSCMFFVGLEMKISPSLLLGALQFI